MTTTIFIHGYRYTVNGPDHTQANNTSYKYWKAWNNEPIIEFKWRSWYTLVDAWKRGYIMPYHRAWNEAAILGRSKLRDILLQLSMVDEPIIIICHSLGSRMVLSALDCDQYFSIDKVVILNGAELSHNALRIARKRYDIKFFNIGNQNDTILKYWGGLFAPGWFYKAVIGVQGLGWHTPFNWNGVLINSPAVRTWASKNDCPISDDDPDKIGDHRHLYENENNAAFLKKIIDDDIKDLPINELFAKV